MEPDGGGLGDPGQGKEPAQRDALVDLAVEVRLRESAARLAGTPGAVELRNRHWYGGSDGTGKATQWTMDMLRDLGLTYVMVDGPQGLESSVPPVAGVTTPELAMVRLHQAMLMIRQANMRL